MRTSAVVPLVLICMLTGCGTPSSRVPACDPVVVYQGQFIYAQLSGHEQRFQGTVVVRQLGEPTPDKIMGRYYTLTSGAVSYPLPTPSGPQVLAGYIGRQVTLHGKLQALIWPDDGLSHDELWIGDLCTTD